MSAGTLERLVTGLVGGAFALRVLDANKSWPIRAGYGLVGYDLLSAAWQGGSIFNGPQQTGLVQGTRAAEGRAFPQLTDLNFVEKKVATIDERVALVCRQMIQGTRDPKVYALAREVISKQSPNGEWITPEKDNLAEIRALFFAIKKRVRYVWDPLDYDSFQTPAKTLHMRSGDCDDYSSLLGAVLRTIGMKVRLRVVRTTGNSSWNHIYVLVQVPGTGEWMPLDLTVNQPPGWEIPKQYVQEVKDFDVVESGGARALPSETQTTADPRPVPGAPF